jgi:hypothetical protein
MSTDNGDGSSGGGASHKPQNLDKMKTALRKIVSVPKAEVDRRIAEERKQKHANRPT